MMTGRRSIEAAASDNTCPWYNPRGARHLGRSFAPQTNSHEGVGVKRALGPALSFFFKLRSTAHRCRPVELWATHCVVQAQRQIHRVAGPVHRRGPENALSDRDYRTTDGIVPLRSVARAHLSTAA